MKSAFGIEHGEAGAVSKELAFMPMGPRKKASPEKMAALKASFRASQGRQAGQLARAAKGAAHLRRI